jgi:hypothetical protein
MDMHRILFIHGAPRTILLYKKKQKWWAAGYFERVCALYTCSSMCQYAWVAHGDHFLHVGRGYSVDLYRILGIHALARAMWMTSTGSRIVCLWVAVAWMRPVQVRQRLPVCMGCIYGALFAYGMRMQRGYAPYLGHTWTPTHPLITQTKAKTVGCRVV